jgi:hypothetical protein
MFAKTPEIVSKSAIERHFEQSEKSNLLRRPYGLGLDFSLRSK